MEFLLALCAFVLGLALIGHGIWLVLAFLVRTIRGESSSSSSSSERAASYCPACDAFLPPRRHLCPSCKLRLDGDLARELEDLETTTQTLRRLSDRSELNPELLLQLLAVVKKRRQLLLQPPEGVRHRLPRTAPARPAPARPAQDDIPVLSIDRPHAETPVLPTPPPPPPPTSLPPPPPVPPVLRPVARREPEPVPLTDEMLVQPIRTPERPRMPAPPKPPQPPAVAPRPRPKPQPPVAPAPRRSWSDMLTGFMEERNILWGELVGGLLIVGCSTALVGTLWDTLEQIRYFPFLMFSAITLALFGAGRYMLSHWKLESTSRGLLMIATLLVPLNLLVLASLSRGQENLGLDILTTVAGLGGLLWTTAGAARVLTPGAVPWLTLGVVAPAAAQLITVRLGRVDHWIYLLPTLLSAGSFAAALGARNQLDRSDTCDASSAHALLRFLGLTTFSLIIAVGFFLSRAVDVRLAVQQASLALVIVAVPILNTGLRMIPRVRENVGTEGHLRTIFTGVALTGMFGLLMSLVLAWPQPQMLFLVCAINTIALTGLAFHHRAPFVHFATIPCLVVGYLLAFHLTMGQAGLSPSSAELARLLLQSNGGAALAVLVLLLAGLSEYLARRQGILLQHAWVIGGGALSTGFLSLALAHGQLWEQSGVFALITLLYGGTALATNLRWQQPLLTLLGHALGIVAGLSITLVFAPGYSSWLGFTLASEAVLLAGLACWKFPEGSIYRILQIHVSSLAWWLIGLAVFASGAVPNYPDGIYSPTGLLLMVATGLLACLHRLPAIAWLPSLFLLLGLGHFYFQELPAEWIEWPHLIALLTHSSLLTVGWLAWTRGETRRGGPWQDLFLGPLTQSALLTTFLALGLLSLSVWEELFKGTLYLLWISALWFILAIVRRSAGWFSAFQATLAGTVLLATATWIQTQPWGIGPIDLTDWRTLHTLGCAFTLLSLGWVALRLWLRARAVRWPMLEPSWLGFDRLALGALPLFALILGTVGGVIGSVRELTPLTANVTLPALAPSASAEGSWLFLGLLSITVLASLWDRPLLAVLAGTLLALAVPLNLAMHWDAELATASAIRWGLTGTLLLGSCCFWWRDRLHVLAQRLAVDTANFARLLLPVRQVLLLATAVPVLFVTGSMASLGFAGDVPSGPLGDTLFGLLGLELNYLLPLALLSVAFAGHALRERSPLHAFAAGQIAMLTVVGGYALAIARSGASLGFVEVNQLLQLASLVFASWALLWMLVPPFARAWTDSTQSGLNLMLTQIKAACLTAAVALFFPVAALVVQGPQEVVESRAIVMATVLGWAAFLTSALAPFLRQVIRREKISWHVLGLFLLASVAMTACTIERLLTGWGYRALMLGSALLALGWSLGAWLQGRIRPRSLLSGSLSATTALPWVLGISSLVILLALKGALTQNDWLPASLAVALVSLAGVNLALWLRSESGLFLSGLGVNLSASLLACYLHGEQLTGLWLSLTQANLLAFGGVGLLWLLLDRWQTDRPTSPTSSVSLLALQCCLGLLGLGLLLVVPLGQLLNEPGALLSAPLNLLASPGMLLGWVLASAAAVGYAWRHERKLLADMLGVSVLLLALLAACWADQWQILWCAYLTLLGVVALACCTLTLLAVFAERVAAGFTRWAHLFAALLILLGIRLGALGPWAEWTSASPVLLATLCLALLGWSFRWSLHVPLTGGLLVLAGTQVWLAWSDDTMSTLILYWSVSLALGAWCWSLVLPWRPALQSKEFPYPPLALWGALSLVGLLVVAGLLQKIISIGGDFSTTFAACTLAICAVAILPSLWDRDNRFASLQLFSVGLFAVVLFIQSQTTFLLAHSGFVLAIYLSSTAVFCWILQHTRALTRGLGWPERLCSGPCADWFSQSQLMLIFLSLGLSVATSLWGLTLAERLFAPLTLTLLLVAALVVHQLSTARWEMSFRPLVLILPPLLALTLGWALVLDTQVAIVHHAIVALVVCLIASQLYLECLPALFGPTHPWSQTGRQLGMGLCQLSMAALFLVLGQEFRLYDKVTRATPLAGWEVLAVLLAIVAFGFLAIRAALSPSTSLRRGQWLIYGTEGLLVLLFVHLKLSVPWMFGTWGSAYWPFLVMLLAYLSVGLGELFHRRQLLVLSGPLQRTGMILPMLPLLVFWIRPSTSVLQMAESLAPGVAPMLAYLNNLPWAFDQHAALWGLLSGLLAVVAAWRQSFRYSLLASLAANVGLWALLLHWKVAFLLHPQAWLIPLALIILTSEHINRHRLSRDHSLTLRYLGLGLLYISSTADLFLVGLGQSVTLPLILACLSILGVLAGILFRVQAFLLVGVAFLCIDIFCMIWHAAVDRTQTWIWYVSGIILGTAILALFAVFEKRRNDVLRLLEEFKRWD